MGKLKRYSKVGARNENNEVIIPVEYGDIFAAAGYLALDKSNSFTTIDTRIYLAYKPIEYHLYSEFGRINCPFEIKFYYMADDIIKALKSPDGYWHLVTIDAENNTVKVLFEDLITEIVSIEHNHVVYRRQNMPDLFIYSFKKKKVILHSSTCDNAKIHNCGIFLMQSGKIKDYYDYSGANILKFNFDDNSSMNFFTIDIDGKQYFLCEINNGTNSKHSLWQLFENSDMMLLHSGYEKISHYFHLKVLVSSKAGQDILYKIDVDSKGCLILNKIIIADKIEPLEEPDFYHLAVWQNQKVGAYNLDCKIIVPIEFTSIEYDLWRNKIFAYKGLFKIKHIFDF